MKINLLPAIAIVGPPHSGKSVLSYMLSVKLMHAGIAHYLLRAVPDGEGNWFLAGDHPSVRSIRLKHKVGYSNPYINHMVNVIESRNLPLLVDIGGLPTPKQLPILQACSHSILLWRIEQEQNTWENMLHNLGIPILANLKSCQGTPEHIDQLEPVITGHISGLERDVAMRSTGFAFDELFKRISGIFYYEEDYFEIFHKQSAPLPIIDEVELAEKTGKSTSDHIHWEPDDLPKVVPHVSVTGGCALYGRGPAWLTAAVATAVHPWPFALFDVCYGWMTIHEQTSMPNENMILQVEQGEDMTKYSIHLPFGFIEPNDFYIPKMKPMKGVIFSGKLPRWAFTTLVRAAQPVSQWIGIFDPVINGYVVVYSRDDQHSLGEVVP